jgi:hypothetical protein
MYDANELKSDIDKLLSKMEDLRLDVGELDESRANVTTRVERERTKQLLGEAIDQLCLMYAEVSE